MIWMHTRKDWKTAPACWTACEASCMAASIQHRLTMARLRRNMRIMPRIRIDDIVRFIDDVPYISDLQKRFYKTYITARYDRMIVPAYERLMR